jgi:glycosyltransferase involved in cell wall biosynthesis
MYPTPSEPWYGSFVRDQAEDLRSAGTDVRVVQFDGRQDWRNYLRAARSLRQLVARESFDLVHAHYGLTGAIAITQQKVPTVTTFHGSDYTGAVPWQKYVSWVVARHTVPVFVSRAGRTALGVDSAEVIPAGVDTQLFMPMERAAARRTLGWEEGARYVLLLGSRKIRAKRADLFDAVVAEVRKSVARVVGVSLEGFSREKTALVMNAADVAVMTSDREGSPVTVRESLACQTPVVSVDVGDVLDVVAGLPGCTILPREPRALASGVVVALETQRSPELRARAEEYSRPRIAERLATLYERVVAEELGHS